MQTLPPLEITPKIETRFWALVRKGDGPDSCWEWTGGRWKRNGKPTYGYFKVKVDGVWKRYKAHRISYLIEHGHFPTDLACHTCDNEGCVRPRHLFDGTNADNNADMVKKGRQARGERTMPNRIPKGEFNGNAKLTEAQVVELLDRFQSGEEIASLALVFGMSRRTVWEIVRGKTWTHVERPLNMRTPTNRGSAQGSSKLTADQVREIRRRRALVDRPTVDALAKEYGLHRVYVFQLLARRTWAWLPDDGPVTPSA